MSKIAIVLAVLGAITLAGGLVKLNKINKQQAMISADNIPTPVWDSWVHWKQHHGKAYGTDTEEQYRAVNFYGNFKHIQSKYADKTLTFTLELNQFADLNKEEFKQMYLQTSDKFSYIGDIKTLDTVSDDNVDWRAKGGVTDVKDQGQCGSCWAFSTTGSLEGLNFLKTGKLVAFSEQQLVDCAKGSLIPPILPNLGCNGGAMTRAFRYAEYKGLMTEADYPYTAKGGSCQYNKAKATMINKTYANVSKADNDQLKAAIVQQPVSVAIDGESIQLYKSGVFNDWSCYNALNHGVLAVGYGTDATAGEFYLVKNSWNKTWGEAGYIRLARKEGKGTGMCGITQQASYPTMGTNP